MRRIHDKLRGLIFPLIFLLLQRGTGAFTTLSPNTVHSRRTTRRTGSRGYLAAPRTCLQETSSSSGRKSSPKAKQKGATAGGKKRQPNHKSVIKRNSLSNGEYRKLNQRITQQETALDLLSFLSSQKGALTTKASGGVMNSVNFSTTFHRIARHVNNMQSDDPRNDRSKVLTDPRFALLLCSAAEGMLLEDSAFGAREYSNMAWAIAKLKVTPPVSAMPLASPDSVEEQLADKSAQIREIIVAVAKERQSNAGSDGANQTPWIPPLSELSALILDTISIRVIGVNPNAFRLQEWSNLLWALATTGRGSPEVFDFILRSLVKGQTINTHNKGQEEEHRPQEWSNSLWALATSGFLGPEESFIPFVASLMDSSPEFVDQFKPQELSNTMWGVATILSNRPGQPTGELNAAALSICRHITRQMIKRQGYGFKTQEFTNLGWALATIGFGSSMDIQTAERSDYTVLTSDEITGDSKLLQDTASIIIEDVKSRVWKYRSQELNNILWAHARMGLINDEALGMIAMELGKPRRAITSQDIGTSLWGMATSNLSNPEAYKAVVARWTPAMASRAKPQELSNSVWALATAEIFPKFVDCFDTTILTPKHRERPKNPQEDPVITALVLAAQEMMRRPDEFKTQELKDILWSFSRLGIRHPDLFRFAAEYIVGKDGVPGRSFRDFSVQAVGNTAWAYARQAQLGADTIQRFKGRGVLPKCGGRLAHYIVIFADVGEALIHELFYSVAEIDLVEFDNMNRMTPQDISNTAWAFAIVGLQHTPLLEAVASQLENNYNKFSPQEMANALWALATLDYRPEGLLQKLESPILSQVLPGNRKLTTKTIAESWKRQELANLSWVCAVFGEYPREMIRMIYMGLLGVGDDPNPDVVTRIHASAGLGPDDGIGSSAVMSITYLQMMMDLDRSMPSFIQLPDDFPDGWLHLSQSEATSRRPTGTTAQAEGLVERRGSGGDLELNRSNLQQNVGAALQRVGFTYVDEYVLDIATLSREYGILGNSAMTSEILSLDMANPDRRLGVEVDGPGHFITNIDNFREEEKGAYKESKIYESTNPDNPKVEVVFGWNGQSSRLVTKINGPTALKLRLFRSMGWTIYNIPFWDWQQIQGDEDAEENYCRSLLGDT